MSFSMDKEKLPKAIDLSHHLSELSKARETSPLKGLAKYYGKPGLISLAGGLPDPSYFPFSSISGQALVTDSFASSPPAHNSSLTWLWKLFGAGAPYTKEKTSRLSIPKYAPNPEDVQLSVALQYGMATGLVALQNFLREFTEKVYQPPYSDFEVLVDTGNTDGWSRAVMSLCNRGEMILTEEWTYPSALASARPWGVHAAPVKMDHEGMSSDDLRKVLSEWDESARGAPRPHVMYTVPVGQNPTGATMGATRKKDIYDICVEFDVIIVEDDPYYFLQEGNYIPKAQRSHEAAMTADDEEAAFISQLAPSFLKFDYEGRVIRLDTFSKTIAPGSRLGWFTCNPLFAERLQRQGETTTQAPCGFGQSLIAQLLSNHWGYKGYIRWLRGIRTEYTMRRDFLVDCLSEAFHLHPTYVTNGSWSGCTAYVARSKSTLGISDNEEESIADEKSALGQKTLFTFVPPTSGMFVWVKVDFASYPSYQPGDEETLEMKLWDDIAKKGLLLSPGSFFLADTEDATLMTGHFRMSFSNGERDTLKKAVDIFAGAVEEFFQV